jgi:hypothetical protein
MGLRAGAGGALPDCSGVTALMVRNLEAEEGVDGLERFGIGGGDLDLGAARCVGVLVADLVAESSHRRCARRRGVVNEHGNVEIAGGEALDDVGKVHANFVAGGGIFGVVCGDVDGTAGFVEAEVVGGCLVGETHGVVTPGGDGVVVGGVLCPGGG